MKLFLVFMLGLFLGFCTMLLLPFLFVVWLQSFIIETREPVQCDGGDESTPLVDAIMRDNFVADLEKRLEANRWKLCRCRMCSRCGSKGRD